MPIAHVGDIDLAYDDHGSGPPILFIMGLTGNRGHWRDFPQRFAASHRVVTFDNRGVGESSAPRGVYTVKQMADDSLGLLDHLGIGKTTVFGVSMGGMIAQEIALAAPARVERLILGCTSFGGGSSLPPDQAVQQAFLNIGKDGPEASIRRILSTNFSEKFLADRPDVIEELVAYGLQHRMTPVGFQGQISAVATHDTAGRLGDLRTKTLLVTGDQDLLIPVGNSKLIAALLPDARVVVLHGVGHMFWVEAGDAAEIAIREFLG